MGNTEKQSDVQAVLKDRDMLYGKAWLLTGRLFESLVTHEAPLELIWRSGYFHAWYMIFIKLIRALFSPYKEDHWLDIQGYAKLVHDDILSSE